MNNTASSVALLLVAAAADGANAINAAPSWLTFIVAAVAMFALGIAWRRRHHE